MSLPKIQTFEKRGFCSSILTTAFYEQRWTNKKSILSRTSI
ncbi:hypothetical protein DB42_BV00200 [Neochlamydia sp. EPS4]|nr:hypothetical protein DB42_BV00200 [Neochlamydia sp. EPS4]